LGILASVAFAALVSQGPEPILLSEREIGPATEITGGTAQQIKVGDSEATLFLPTGWKPRKKNQLWVHFHTAAWFIIRELQRAKITEPILVFNLGQGSSTYAKPFASVGSFKPWLAQAQVAVGPIDRLHFTSFSAGYGAVRQLIQDADVLKKLRTVILADSMYGSLDPTQSGRVVLREHATCWNPLIELARKGKTIVIMTTSQITPETYAGTWELGLAMAKEQGLMMTEVPENSHRAAVGSQRLLRRLDDGRWFVWSYAGDQAVAHVTHPRHLAELIVESQRR